MSRRTLLTTMRRETNQEIERRKMGIIEGRENPYAYGFSENH